MRRALARSVNGNAASLTPDGILGRLDGQLWTVALLAQVKQDQVLEDRSPRSFQYGRHQIGALLIGQMALIAQVTSDQHSGPARRLLHSDVVIELDPKHVEVGKAIDHHLRPASRVGEVADGRRPLPPLRRYLDPKAECRPSIVHQSDRLDSQAAGREKWFIIVGAAKPGKIELLKSRVAGQAFAMSLVTVEHNLAPRQLGKRGGIDVIRVDVRENDPADSRPARTDAFQSLSQSFRAHTHVDEQPAVSALDQCRIPA
jgi:hypothetical protein